MFTNYATFHDGKWRVRNSINFPLSVKPRAVPYGVMKLLQFNSIHKLHRGCFVSPRREHIAATWRNPQ